MRLCRGVLGALLGVVPGVVLLLLATFVIEGEVQLTVGAAGVALAFGGAIAGFVVGLSRPGANPG